MTALYEYGVQQLDNYSSIYLLYLVLACLKYVGGSARWCKVPFNLSLWPLCRSVAEPQERYFSTGLPLTSSLCNYTLAKERRDTRAALFPIATDCFIAVPLIKRYFSILTLHLFHTMQASPLADCTNATMQALNRASNTPAAGKHVATVRHNPYACCLLAPENSICSSMSNYSSPFNWASDVSPHDSFYATYAPYSQAEEFDVNRPLFPRPVDNGTVTGLDTSVVVDTASHNTPATHNGSTTATPMKSIGKVYVGGRPMPVYRRHTAELMVELRSGEAPFIVNDVYSIFPTEAEMQDLVGLYVIVEGDRGVDMGVVRSVIRSEVSEGEKELEKACRANPATTAPAPRNVLRHANTFDITQFELQPKAEDEALEHCRRCLAAAQLSVPITIERAIFQFDRKKLTLQYVSDAYVDFNALTRILHSHYKCRIWMDQLNREAAPPGVSDKRSSKHDKCRGRNDKMRCHS